MTEAYEDTVLVRVRAQAMCRDEGTGGWLALGGGGLANVRLGKRLAGAVENSEEPRPQRAPVFEYYIHGVRISDETEVLACTIKKDFQYNKVMPTFHHWLTDERRYGLTFQTAADARAFDRGVRTAIEELLDGLGGAWPSLHTYKKHNPGPKSDDEENIFECLNLPSDSRSSSEASAGSRRRETPILSAITLPRHLESSHHQFNGADEDKCNINETAEHCSYVHLSAVHEYQYPTMSSGVMSAEPSPPLDKQSSGSMKTSFAEPPPLPDKKPAKPEMSRVKCRHCHEWYIESANRAGACEYSPDACAACVSRASCMTCAQGMLYHCMADSEGDFSMHPCACAAPSVPCYKRWLCVGMLSIVVPCLWCYIPLHCLHRAAKATRISGSLHEAEPPPEPPTS